MILKNVELYWAKLSPSNHDMGFSGDKPQWNVQMRVRTKEQAEEWKGLGLNPKIDEDDAGTYYKISAYKEAIKKDGTANKPVAVIGPDLMPLEDVSAIGNGTTANVKLRSFDWEFNGKKGLGIRLEAIQVIKQVVYAQASEDAGFGFEALDVPAQSDDGTADLY